MSRLILLRTVLAAAILVIAATVVLRNSSESHPSNSVEPSFEAVSARDDRGIEEENSSEPIQVSDTDGGHESKRLQLSDFLESGTYFALLSLERDFLPMLYELRDAAENGDATAMYAMSLLLRQCRDVRRLTSMSATEFVHKYNVDDPDEITFYFLRETQCRSVMGEGLWTETYPSLNRLVARAAQLGHSVAAVDLAFRMQRTRKDKTRTRAQLITGIATLDPIAMARAASQNLVSPILSREDTLALFVLACEESTDCLKTSGLLNSQCELAGSCISGASMIENFRILIGDYDVDAAAIRASQLRATLIESGWDERVFRWADD